MYAARVPNFKCQHRKPYKGGPWSLVPRATHHPSPSETEDQEKSDGENCVPVNEKKKHHSASHSCSIKCVHWRGWIRTAREVWTRKISCGLLYIYTVSMRTKSKKSSEETRFYVRQIMEVFANHLRVKFLCSHKASSLTFIFLKVDDINYVFFSNVLRFYLHLALSYNPSTNVTKFCHQW